MNDGFIFNTIRNLSEFKDKKNYLILVNPQLQPPHVALGFGEHYFSLTVAGPETEIPLELRIKLYRLRKIPVLFIQLKDSSMTPSVAQLTSVFKEFPPLSEHGSCLQPVVKAIQMMYTSEPPEPLLFGLLDMLDSRNLIGNSFQLNMENLISCNGSFCIERYDAATIKKHIQRLKNRKRQQGRQ